MEVEFKFCFSSSCDNVLHSVITYILPILQLTAFVMNLFNAVLFPKWKNPLNRYLSVNSCVDAIWLILHFSFIQTIFKSGNGFVFTFPFQLLQILTLYLTRVADMISALINIQIAFDRFVFVTKGHIQKNNKMRLITFFLVSFAFYTPIVSFVHIYQIENCNKLSLDNKTLFLTYFSEFTKNHIEIKYFLTSLHYVLTFANLAVMVVLNVLIYKNYKQSKSTTNYTLRVRYFNNEDNSEFDEACENQSTNKESEDNRITLMIFRISCIFIADQFFSIVVSTVGYVANGNKIRTYMISLVFFVLYRSISSILNTVFYYFFYREYR